MGKNNKNYSHTVVIYPLIPVILRHGYTVCCGVSKSTTVPRTLDNRCRGLMRKVKIWAFWTGQNRKIFLKFIRMKSGQHPKPKFSSGLCIRPPKLEKSSGPAHQASKKAPGVWMTP